MEKPEIALIGDVLAVKFAEGTECFFEAPFLREHSPSAELRGESDLFGNVHGGTPGARFPDAKFVNFQWIGGYAIRIFFADGHASGIYSFAYLLELAARLASHGPEAPRE